MKDKALRLIRIALPLFLICTLTTALLAAVNQLTAPVIEKNENAAFDRSVKELYGLSSEQTPTVTALPLPQGEDLPEGAIAAYEVRLEDVLLGHCTEVFGAEGYGGKIRMLVAFDERGQIVDLSCLSQSETPGKGDKILNDDFYSTHYIGKMGTDLLSGNLPTLLGSTKTAKALSNAVSAATALYERIAAKEGGTP